MIHQKGQAQRLHLYATVGLTTDQFHPDSPFVSDSSTPLETLLENLSETLLGYSHSLLQNLLLCLSRLQALVVLLIHFHSILGDQVVQVAH